MSEFKLIEEIVALSVSKVWAEAKNEWSLETIWEEDEPETCLCGHFPIIEVCLLRNVKNNNTAEVGNVCVKKFLGISSDKLFHNIKKIRKDITKAVNPETAEYSFKKRWINEWELNFCKNTFRKRDLSQKQTSTRIGINQKMLNGFSSAAKTR